MVKMKICDSDKAKQGKTAWDFFHKIQQQETELISIKLAEAKLKAVQVGKNPFEYNQVVSRL